MWFEKILTILLLVVGVTATYKGHAKLHHHDRRTTNARYEYIVVGSGPGGGPLAARLALAGHSVLLIEAGEDQGDSIEYKVPALQLQAQEDILQRWDYFVHHYADQERQQRDWKMTWRLKNGTLFTGKEAPEGSEPIGILYPRAGTLGGCAAHNALVNAYPDESDWKYIQELTGDESWAPDQMRSYYEKLEKCQYLPGGTAGHGFDGWLPTSLTDLSLVVKDAKIIELVVGAASAMGQGLLTTVVSTVVGLSQTLLQDLNSPSGRRDQNQGLYQVPLALDKPTSTRAGPREFVLDTANAVNDDGSRKYHLDVQLNTLVTKIRFDRNGSVPRAVGVEYLQGQSLYAADPRYAGASGTPGYITASKEVIISAGTFNTPQLLKLSGVGPKTELESFGIDIVKDLPGVGTNLQDRYEYGIVADAPTDFAVTKDCKFGWGSPDPCLEQWEEGTDAVSRGTYSTSGFALGIVLKSSAATESEDPDLFISGVPGTFKGYYSNYSYYGLGEVHNRWTWVVEKAHSRNSAGTIKLQSTNPQQLARIDFNYFDTGVTVDEADNKDLQAVYEGVLWAREAYSKTIPLDGKFTESFPGTNVSSEADVKQIIKDEAWGHHACCTAAIGADDDEMAVLDSKFQVRGVEGLRVVDASVFPKIPGYFIALPIYMASEKAADVILAEV